jgi:hypothetical protein
MDAKDKDNVEKLAKLLDGINSGELKLAGEIRAWNARVIEAENAERKASPFSDEVREKAHLVAIVARTKRDAAEEALRLHHTEHGSVILAAGSFGRELLRDPAAMVALQILLGALKGNLQKTAEAATAAATATATAAAPTAAPANNVKAPDEVVGPSAFLENVGGAINRLGSFCASSVTRTMDELGVPKF